MHSRPMLLFVLLASVLPATAQDQAFKENMPNSITVFDANGKIFENPNGDIAGSPYFIDGWKYGTIVLANNAVCSKRLLRLDCQQQDVHYLSDSHVEMSLAATYIKELVFVDSSTAALTVYDFQSGFPPVDRQDGKYLYRIISNGRLKMLESTRKIIIATKNDFSGETTKEYRAYKEYYFFWGVSITRIKNDKTFVLGLMTNQKDKIEGYVKQNKLGYKSLEDLKKITDYYNSLQ
jgi:hypothetical protein